MTVSSRHTPMRTKKTKAVGIPTIDLSDTTCHSRVSNLIVEACEEVGFFKVVNHGVPKEVIARMEKEGINFFAKPAMEKQRVGPANPFGYGSKNIGTNGDAGDLEYLLLHSTLLDISHWSNGISLDPNKFSCAVKDYVREVRELTCKILDLVGEGLRLPDKHVFSRLIRDVHNDSVLRLNHYPASTTDHDQYLNANKKIGFGEHSDPQILTLLRSNDVGGLEICLPDGLWLPVPPDPSAFYVMVGDAFQALTNGRFVSLRHRAIITGRNSIDHDLKKKKGRMSMVYFGAPAMDAWICPIPEMRGERSLYKPFTWGQYKKAAYSLRLGDSRLNLFRKEACI